MSRIRESESENLPGYGVTDAHGLTNPNNYVNLFVPATNKSIVLYVKFRKNPWFTLMNYGPLPTTTSSGFSKYASGVAGSSGTGSATPAAAGQCPASSWIKGLQFNVPSTFNVTGTFPSGNGDIWYFQDNTRLFEVAQHLWPGWLRVSVDIPTGQVGENLQDQVAGGVDQDFGWKRGKIFVGHIPGIHYGYGYGNDTNFPVYTRVIFRYAEQVVTVVRDPNVAFAVINNMIPNHLITLPVNQAQSALSSALRQYYGFEGLPVLPRNQEGTARTQYGSILGSLGAGTP